MTVRITVHTKPGARRAEVRKIGSHEYVIAITERPERGRATNAVRRALAAHLGIAPSRVSLIMGATSRTKVFSV